MQITANPNGPDPQPELRHRLRLVAGRPERLGPGPHGSHDPGRSPDRGQNGLGPSPDGGNYLAVDGASSFLSSVSQTVSGLTLGHTYQLSFYDGAGQQNGVPAATLMDHFTVSFGSQTQDGTTYTTSNFGFSGWHLETMNFVATSSSQTLTFMAFGSPNLPPYMVLDGVSLTTSRRPGTFEPGPHGPGRPEPRRLYLRRRARLKAAA